MYIHTQKYFFKYICITKRPCQLCYNLYQEASNSTYELNVTSTYFKNKVLLKHCQAHPFIYYLCLLSHEQSRFGAESVVTIETVWSTKLKIFTICLSIESLPILWLDYCDILKRLQNIVTQTKEKCFFFFILLYGGRWAIQGQKIFLLQSPRFLYFMFCCPVVQTKLSSAS